MMDKNTQLLSRLSFDPWVGQDFTIGEAATGRALRLESVTALTPSIREGGGFRLEFAGSAGKDILQQATYHMSHADFECDIFIVPFAQRGDVIRYEAVFL